MSKNRLGALLAGLVGVGWTIAVGVSAVFWLPQQLNIDPYFYEDGRQFLSFVAENPVSWRVFHLGTMVALLAQLPLIELLSAEIESPLRPVMHRIGVMGAAFALLASLIDQFMTPVLAEWGGLGNVPVAVFIWESVEPFRDNGLKTLSFLMLGIWLTWLGRKSAADWVQKVSFGVGLGLLLLGVVEALVPLPWRNQIGETGVLGLILFGLPFWGFVVANYFWEQEKLAVGG